MTSWPPLVRIAHRGASGLCPENTLLAYRSRWRSFEGWCRDAGRVALPATAQTVAAYLTHLAVDRGLKATTVGVPRATASATGRINSG